MRMAATKRCRTFIFTLSILVLFLSACWPLESIPTQLDEIQNESTKEISFQEYLWQEHPLDLIIQIGILLAGAFGVSALLPSPDEE